MKKILIILGFLFGFAYAQEDLVKKGVEAYKKDDYLTALKYLQKACDLKYGDGCNRLGVMYADGTGVKKDNLKAAKLFKKACDLKVGMGCSNLGIMYEDGIGVKKDLSKALEFYEKSCNLSREDVACQSYIRLKK